MAQYASGSKVIILTEGKSDGWIIAGAMKLLYPHLLGYFTFMDFELARVGGGAPQLANIVKSFAGAGIVNKVIALFDNDTIGKEAVQNLQQLKLPGNLRVLNLPDLPTLRKYRPIKTTSFIATTRTISRRSRASSILCFGRRGSLAHGIFSSVCFFRTGIRRGMSKASVSASSNRGSRGGCRLTGVSSTRP